MEVSLNYVNELEEELATVKEALEVAIEALKDIITYTEFHEDEAEYALDKIESILGKNNKIKN